MVNFQISLQTPLTGNGILEMVLRQLFKILHEYQKQGNYNVTLTITTATGCEATITKAGFVSITPATIGINNLQQGGCKSLIVNPTAIVTSPDGIASYSWDWGDGSPIVTGTATPPPHLSTVGNYFNTNHHHQRRLCTTGSENNKVGEAPTPVDFSATPLSVSCSSDSVRFTANTPTANEWFWNFGDGDTSNLQNPVHVFQDTGKITVTLIAANNGCKAPPVVKTDFITIPSPVAKFGITIDCNNRLKVSFSDSSLIDAKLGPAFYEWDFGDGQTFSAKIGTTYLYNTR